MATTSKDFKVKNGLSVSGDGTFNGPVVVGVSTLPTHAVRKEYVDQAISSIGSGGLGTLDGGDPFTTVWNEGSIDAGTP
jgi:hypothetical protein